MTPYLFEAVEKLLRYLMNRCVKPDLMKCTGPKLLSIDTKKSENLILSKNIDIGFATKRLLGETAITVTERQKLEFIHECRSMLTTMIAKLQEKSPLKQKAVRGLSSLDPCVIQHSPQLAQKRFSFLLEELNHANIINDVLAENAKKEYLHSCIFATSKNLSFKKYFILIHGSLVVALLLSLVKESVTKPISGIGSVINISFTSIPVQVGKRHGYKHQYQIMIMQQTSSLEILKLERDNLLRGLSGENKTLYVPPEAYTNQPNITETPDSINAEAINIQVDPLKAMLAGTFIAPETFGEEEEEDEESDDSF
uniref:Uncharacterized protein n=1 Tax=Timema cristinae TaxID=61476 RepID=A0A7R9H0Q1_TIMCR|nr:unnamed protein product [Timema cristinae]